MRARTGGRQAHDGTLGSRYGKELMVVLVMLCCESLASVGWCCRARAALLCVLISS